MTTHNSHNNAAYLYCQQKTSTPKTHQSEYQICVHSKGGTIKKLGGKLKLKRRTHSAREPKTSRHLSSNLIRLPFEMSCRLVSSRWCLSAELILAKVAGKDSCASKTKARRRRGVQYDRVRVAGFRHGPGYRFCSSVFRKKRLPVPVPSSARMHSVNDDDVQVASESVQVHNYRTARSDKLNNNTHASAKHASCMRMLLSKRLSRNCEWMSNRTRSETCRQVTRRSDYNRWRNQAVSLTRRATPRISSQSSKLADWQ